MSSNTEVMCSNTVVMAFPGELLHIIEKYYVLRSYPKGDTPPRGGVSPFFEERNS